MSFESNRESHETVCSECGEKCSVPFVPRKDSPVYCRSCYAKRKGHSGKQFKSVGSSTKGFSWNRD